MLRAADKRVTTQLRSFLFGATSEMTTTMRKALLLERMAECTPPQSVHDVLGLKTTLGREEHAFTLHQFKSSTSTLERAPQSEADQTGLEAAPRPSAR